MNSEPLERPWSVRVPKDKAEGAAALRLWPNLRVHEDAAGDLWLRGPELTEPLDLELRKLPGAERFTVDVFEGDEVLLPVGKRLPAGFVPDEGWTPIASWFRPTMSASALAGALPAKVTLLLKRSSEPMDATVLVTTSASWTAWAIDAPQVRLRRLSFAASNDGRIIIRGTPLPPIAGLQFVDRQGVAVPSGWSLQHPLDAATVRSLLGTGERDLALLSDDGSWERIVADQFVAATRSAARATVVAASDGPEAL